MKKPKTHIKDFIFIRNLGIMSFLEFIHLKKLSEKHLKDETCKK